MNDVTHGEHLQKSASNSFLEYSYWKEWEIFFNRLWQENVNNVIMVKPDATGGMAVTYQINQAGVKQLVNLCLKETVNRPLFDTFFPGRNFKELGFSVISVCTNML